MDRNALIESCLRLPPDAIPRGLSSALAEAMPGRFIAPTYIGREECKRFASKGHCRFTPVEAFRQEQTLNVYQGAPYYIDETTWYEIEWKGANLELVTIKVLEGDCRTGHAVLMAPSQEVAEAFLVALDAFSNEIEGAVLVFAQDHWSFNEPLFNDIRNSTLDNLILPEGLANTIRNDIAQWLESRELYEEHGIPWKRGMILIGPPGNGKTHMIKALANHFKVSTLYVREFGTRSPARGISEVFQRARSCTPCLLVLEDLDTLVTPKNRSYFLNEMDGFARNTGILVVASANDPAKLDPALVNRPSRFDRRYVFGLPAQPERARYLSFFTSSLAGSLQLSPADSDRIADQTEGFSYAYLKELVLSSMMAWISGGRVDPIAEVMLRELLTLREQMGAAPDVAPASPYFDPDDED